MTQHPQCAFIPHAGFGTSPFCAFPRSIAGREAGNGPRLLRRLLKNPKSLAQRASRAYGPQQRWNAPWSPCNIKAAFTNPSSRCAACATSFRIRLRASSPPCSGAGSCLSNRVPLRRLHAAIARFLRRVSMLHCPSSMPPLVSPPQTRSNSPTTSIPWTTC